MSASLFKHLLGTTENEFIIGKTNATGGIEQVVVNKVTTTTAVAANLATIDVSEGCFFGVEATVIACKNDNTKHSFWKKSAAFYRNPGGNVTQLKGATITIVEIKEDYTTSFAANTVTQQIEIKGTGKAGDTVYWKCGYKYWRFQP